MQRLFPAPGAGLRGMAVLVSIPQRRTSDDLCPYLSLFWLQTERCRGLRREGSQKSIIWLNSSRDRIRHK